ncbi:MAG: hypothetical protein LIP16_01820 [Clostridium sp.]|nr:hypothetical protein [Clostridium sp.]
MRKGCRHLNPLAFLAICAVLASGGCMAPSPSGSGEVSGSSSALPENRGADKTAPAYVYYIKDGDLMRADVHAGIEEGVNPSVVLEGAGPYVNLKDYYDVRIAEDGSFLVFMFKTEEDAFSSDEMLVAVNDRDGRAELIYEGCAYTYMCGSKLLFQIENESKGRQSVFNVQTDLYSYTPEQGKKLEISDIYNFYPSVDGSVICFTRLDEEGNQELYRYEDGRELLLARNMEFIGADEDFSNVYVEQAVEDEELPSREIIKIGKDGTKEYILTKDDQGMSCYLHPESGSLYYMVYGEEGRHSLYYASAGEKKLLSDEAALIWEYMSDEDWLEGGAMITYMDAEGTLFAAMGGTVSRFTIPDIPDDALKEYNKEIAGSENGIYLTVSRLDDDYRPEESWIYRYELSSGRLSSRPEQIGHGTELRLAEDKDGRVFYTDYLSDMYNLYCDGVKVLEGSYGTALSRAGAGELFAFRDGNGEAPDLVRITSGGSSKLFRENVVQCESYAEGLLLLSDCRDGYPYLGTLSFYDAVSGIKEIDEDVTVFFQHDEGQFRDMTPRDWDWSGREKENDDYMDLSGRVYIEGAMFYNREYGFSMDLEGSQAQGYYFEIAGYGGAKPALVCRDADGYERYSIYMSEIDSQIYEEYKEHNTAAQLGQWMKDMFDASMKAYGYENGSEDFVVEKGEDILLDGRKAIKLVIRTKSGLMTNDALYIRYFIEDVERSRLIELSRQFFEGLETEEDREAYQEMVESLKWDS